MKYWEYGKCPSCKHWIVCKHKSVMKGSAFCERNLGFMEPVTTLWDILKKTFFNFRSKGNKKNVKDGENDAGIQ